jgi:chromosome partitioning protein
VSGLRNVYTVINQKGGVGKSTTVLSLGAGFAIKGFKVLFVDMDAQGNLTHSLGSPENGASVFDVLTGDAGAEEAIVKGERWDCITSSPELAGADLSLGSTGKEFKLKEAIAPVLQKYDYVVIDTPPALGILTINALTACTGAIVPSQADIYSLLGIGQLHGTIQAVKKYCNPTLKISGILLTRYNRRSILSRDVADMIEQTAERLETVVYKATIREAVAIRESQAQQKDIFTYAPKGAVTADYKKFVEEVLSNE